MCGIAGIIGKQPVVPLLLKSLKRLEYRGYDSSGIATLEEGILQRRRAKGKLDNLEAQLHKKTALRNHWNWPHKMGNSRTSKSG